jgi:hypothetical protein
VEVRAAKIKVPKYYKIGLRVNLGSAMDCYSTSDSQLALPKLSIILTLIYINIYSYIFIFLFTFVYLYVLINCFFCLNKCILTEILGTDP